MPRPPSKQPALCHDKFGDRAFVTLRGKKIVLGKYGSPESEEAYHRVLSEWISAGRPTTPPTPTAGPAPVLVNQVVHQFWAHAKTAYPCPPYPEGRRPSGELGNYWDALRPLVRLYGTTPAADFGPKKLKAVREYMIRPREEKDPETNKVTVRPGWCRNVANRHVHRLKLVFKWAGEEELVSGTVYAALATVSALRRGKSEARETEPVKPVPQAYVDAVLPHLNRQVEAMVRLQLLTAMRPGEVCGMRGCDLDTSGAVWVYEPPQHKTAHHGHKRTIPLGPKAQELLRPLLKADVRGCLFSPAEAEEERQEKRREARNPKTPVTPSQARRAELARQRPRQRPPRDHYTTRSYRRNVVRACAKADAAARTAGDADGVPTWTVGQLRHNAATLLRRLYGLEAARIVLGHSSPGTTEIYAEIDHAKGEKIAAEVG